MKTLVLLGFVFAFNAYAQLEKPSAIGVCRGNYGIDVTVINGQVQVKVEKKPFIKSCVMKISNATIFLRKPMENVTFYVVPEGCSGRARGEQGFDSGPLLDRGFIEIGKSGQGIVHLLKEEKPFACKFDVKNWKKLEELAKENRS